MKNVLGILFAIALIIFFLQNVCKPRVKDTAGEAALKEMIKAKDDTLILYRQIRAKDSATINEAGQASADSRERAELLEKEVKGKQQIIDRLTFKIEIAKKEKEDSTWKKVSPRYIEGCDSLVTENKSLASSNEQYQNDNAETVRLMLYEIAVRDSALTNERDFNAKFQTQLNNCLTQLQNKATKKQPLQLYAGIGLLGNKINPLVGGQVNVSLRARNSQIYEVTGAMVGNTWYGGVGTKLLITFRK